MKQEPNYKFYYKNDFRPLASLSLHDVAGFDCPPGHVLPLKRAAGFNGVDALLLLNASRFDSKAPVRYIDDENADNIVRFMAGLCTYRGQDIYGTTQSTSILELFGNFSFRTTSLEKKQNIGL